jgi:hypothetical protein
VVTLVTGGHAGDTYRSVTLVGGQLLDNQNFAWYRFTGPTPTPTPTTVPDFLFTPTWNVYCHTGPDRAFDTLDVAMGGQGYPIDGRNLEGTWLRIMLTQARGCWVLAFTGKASIDIAAVRVLISPATPTPTPVVDCSSYKDEKSCEAQATCQWKLSTAPAAVVTYSCTEK